MRHVLLVGFAVLAAVRSEAGAWTLPAGETFFKIGFFYQDTTERYFLDGERIPYFFEGRNRTRALFFELAHGLTDRLEVKAQFPMFRISFDDLADQRTSTGPGDLRFETRFNAIRAPFVLTVGGTVKFPTGEFVNDAEIVPVGEGQYDYDVFAEIGRSLWPKPGYVTGKIGYRFRTENEQSGIDFGNEIVWQAELGYRVAALFDTKVVFRGLYGGEAQSFGLPISTLRREAVYIEPGVSVRLGGRRALEVSVPVSVHGRNWPAGPVLNVSFSQSF